MNFRKLINTLDHIETNPTTVLHEADQSGNVIGMIQRYLKRGYIPSIKVDGVNTPEMSAVILTYRTLLLKNAAAILGNYSKMMPNIITNARTRANDPRSGRGDDGRWQHVPVAGHPCGARSARWSR